MSSVHIFGKRLKLLRKRHDETQEDLAIFFSVTRAAVGNWEREAIPREPILSGLADRYNVSVDYLLGRTDLPNPPAKRKGSHETDLLAELPSEDQKQVEDYIAFLKAKYK